MFSPNPAQVEAIMEAEGVDYMQAVNIARAVNIMEANASRKPRAFDFRFGKEF